MVFDTIKQLYDTTDLTISEIAERVGLSMFQTWTFISKEYSKEIRDTRKSICYKNSKLGIKNPMSGKFKTEHHNFVGDVSDGKGYLMRLKPEWYTGRKGCKHVFVHHITMCESLGLTEIPKGWCVHHIDENKHNNSLNNLTLLTLGAHTRLHQLERATTISKESRA